MKSVCLSGVFVLASAGLALATAEPSATVKPEAATAAPAVVQAAIAEKKDAAPAATAAAAGLCEGAADAPICGETASKN
ncbi:hypothetical protein [Roseicyclus persicicus]|uniref:Uncharacterized protein n=1 Tax=Roseicyclus persicicus TaxID=2650661 RepID=A0A7X6H1B9_9RHOB|nr:hypothetical protein [Roseibacterium persicicum]NKX46236.1 hypothetical protein [Roseibacterium persicicum]